VYRAGNGTIGILFCRKGLYTLKQTTPDWSHGVLRDKAFYIWRNTREMMGKPTSVDTSFALGKALRLPSALLVLVLVALYSANAPQASTAQSVPQPQAAVTAPAPTAPAVAPEASTETSATAVPAVFSRNKAQGLSPKVLAMALDAVSAARARGISGRDDRLTVIDYSLPSTQPRIWVLDTERGKVLYHGLVAHGAGSGDKYASHFSNVNDSRATSLGLFLTGDTYEGGNGYSLKLLGLDPGVNDLAEMRHIVMHGAWYVSDEHARQFGMIGRSWGCPALAQTDAQSVIDTIKGGTFVYSYAASAAPSVLRASYRTASVGNRASSRTSSVTRHSSSRSRVAVSRHKAKRAVTRIAKAPVRTSPAFRTTRATR